MSVLTDRQREFAQILARLMVWAGEQGYAVRMGDAWRSTDPLKCPHCQHLHTYQGMLLFNGRSQKAYSTHSDRLAVDLLIERRDGVPMTDSDWLKLGEFWEDHGGTDWGGRYDVPPEHRGSKVGWDRGHFGMKRP